MPDLHHDLREIHSIGDSQEQRVLDRDCEALGRHGLIHVGISQAGAGFSFVRHRPTMVQVLVTLAGAGEALVAGRWQTVAAGTAYVTPAKARHAYRHLGKRWNVVWAILTPDRQSGFAPAIVSGDPRPLHDAVGNLYREGLGARDPAMQDRWAGLVRACADRWLPSHKRRHDRLHHVWEAVAEDLAHPWCLRELAELIGVSGEQLRRLCQQSRGHAPMQELTRLRLSRARQLLLHSDTPVHRIAQQVGYQNAFAFSTACRRHFGCSPSTLRQRG